MSIDPKENWAHLDRETLDAIIEYAELAFKELPEEFELDVEEAAHLIKVQSHLLLCIRSLLLHCDDKYRKKIELKMKESEKSNKKNFIS